MAVKTMIIAAFLHLAILSTGACKFTDMPEHERRQIRNQVENEILDQEKEGNSQDASKWRKLHEGLDSTECNHVDDSHIVRCKFQDGNYDFDCQYHQAIDMDLIEKAREQALQQLDEQMQELEGGSVEWEVMQMIREEIQTAEQWYYKFAEEESQTGADNVNAVVVFWAGKRHGWRDWSFFFNPKL